MSLSKANSWTNVLGHQCNCIKVWQRLFILFFFFFCKVSISGITQRWKTVMSQAKVKHSDKLHPQSSRGLSAVRPQGGVLFSWINTGNITKVKNYSKSALIRNVPHGFGVLLKRIITAEWWRHHSSSLDWFPLPKWQHIQFVNDGSDNLSPWGKDSKQLRWQSKINRTAEMQWKAQHFAF